MFFFQSQQNRLVQLAYNHIPIMLTMFGGFLLTAVAFGLAFTTSNKIVIIIYGIGLGVYFLHFAVSSGSPTALTPNQNRIDRENGFTGLVGGILCFLAACITALLFWIF